MNSKIELPPGVELPLNLGLNDGIWCAQGALDAMKGFDSRTSLRWYTDPDNNRLRDTIAALDGVERDQIFLRNGSGPILKQVFPHIVRTEIKRSPLRMLKHLISKNGYPIVTGRFTYSKVPRKGAEEGLTLHLLPMGPDTDFKLDLNRLEALLKKQDSIVYLCNPNNPTGTVLIQKDEVRDFANRFPRSMFWIDEAYVQYIDPRDHDYVSPLVRDTPNLVVSRTFSFAYGMAGVRIGYLLGPTALVKTLNSQLTNYRIGGLQEAMAVASLNDPRASALCARECPAGARKDRGLHQRPRRGPGHAQLGQLCAVPLHRRAHRRLAEGPPRRASGGHQGARSLGPRAVRRVLPLDDGCAG